MWNSLHSEQSAGLRGPGGEHSHADEADGLKGSHWTGVSETGPSVCLGHVVRPGALPWVSTPRGTLSVCPKALFRCGLPFTHLCHSCSFRVCGVSSTVHCMGHGTRDAHRTEPVPVTMQLATRGGGGVCLEDEGGQTPHRCTPQFCSREFNAHGAHRELLAGFTNKGAIACPALQKDHPYKPRKAWIHRPSKIKTCKQKELCLPMNTQ